MSVRFCFTETPLTAEEKAALLSQLARALDKRLEIHSRRTVPGIWSVTDRLNSMAKAPEAVLRRRWVRYRIYGVILLILGLLLLIPALAEPGELTQLLVLGALCLLSGALYLRPRREGPRRREWDQAKKLLDVLADSRGSEVVFDPEGVSVRAGESCRQISYGEINALVETDDLYVLSFSTTGALILKKRDMTEGEPADFLPLLSERTGFTPAGI